MPKKTTVSFIISTDDQGNRTVEHAVFVGNPDQFESEEAKEQSTTCDINHLFDKIDLGMIDRKTFL